MLEHERVEKINGTGVVTSFGVVGKGESRDLGGYVNSFPFSHPYYNCNQWNCFYPLVINSLISVFVLTVQESIYVFQTHLPWAKKGKNPWKCILMSSSNRVGQYYGKGWNENTDPGRKNIALEKGRKKGYKLLRLKRTFGDQGQMAEMIRGVLESDQRNKKKIARSCGERGRNQKLRAHFSFNVKTQVIDSVVRAKTQRT